MSPNPYTSIAIHCPSCWGLLPHDHVPPVTVTGKPLHLCPPCELRAKEIAWRTR